MFLADARIESRDEKGVIQQNRSFNGRRTFIVLEQFAVLERALLQKCRAEVACGGFSPLPLRERGRG